MDLKTKVQMFLRRELSRNEDYEVWADTEWESVSDAQRAHPNEHYRVVSIGQDMPTPPLAVTA